MFMFFKPQAAKLQRWLLRSIGDHLDLKTDEQDITKANLYIDIEVVEKISQGMSEIIEKALNYLITVKLIDTRIVANKPKQTVEEELNILIRKSDDYIIHPDFT